MIDESKWDYYESKWDNIVILTMLFIFLFSVYRELNKLPVEKTGPLIEIYDGCEYIVNQSTHGYRGFSHKGNCTNVIHRPTIKVNLHYM